MDGDKVLIAGLVAMGVAIGSAADASASARRAHGPTRLGPWVQEGWERQDWSRAPAVRDWGWSAPWDYAVAGFPASNEWYPWGYTTPFARVGRKCVASEINGGPGGDWVRYQRVRPSYYCNY